MNGEKDSRLLAVFIEYVLNELHEYACVIEARINVLETSFCYKGSNDLTIFSMNEYCYLQENTA